MAKPTYIEKLLQVSGMMKDYEKAFKLWKRYENEKNPDKKAAQKQELLLIVKAAEETLGRLLRVYGKAAEELKAEAKEIDLPIQQSDAYLDEIRRRHTLMTTIQAELSPSKPAPKPPTPPQEVAP